MRCAQSSESKIKSVSAQKEAQKSTLLKTKADLAAAKSTVQSQNDELVKLMAVVRKLQEDVRQKNQDLELALGDAPRV